MELDSAQQFSSAESRNAFECLHHPHLLSLHFLLRKLLYIDIAFNCLSTVANYIKFKMHYTNAYRFYYYLLVNENLQNLKTNLCKTHSRNYKTQRSIHIDIILSSLKLLDDFSSVLVTTILSSCLVKMRLLRKPLFSERERFLVLFLTKYRDDRS